MTTHTVRLVLGDQLNQEHSWFRSVDSGVLYVLLELRQETDYVRHHRQKVLAIFAAMERFAGMLRNDGHRVEHRTLDHPLPGADLPAMLRGLATSECAHAIEYQEPDEYRLHAQLSEAFGAGAASEHFLYPRDGVAKIFAGKTQRVMETFYRRARVEHGVLLDDAGGPLGGQWNFDADNRERMPLAHALPPALEFAHDVREIEERLVRHGVQTIGRANADALPWPLDRREQLLLLAHCCSALLPNFGRYQDHLGPQHWAYYHSRLSFGLNTKMLHPLEVIRHNTDKHYLGELAAQGLSVVPSRYVEPDDRASAKLEAFLSEFTDAAEFVVKPCVGAGSRDAQRYSRAQVLAARAHIERLQSQRRSVLLQPYLANVDDAGETALMYFDGVFSHAIRKGPLLQRDAGPTRALFAPEKITARTPGADELALAEGVLAALAGGPLAYARVDLIRGPDGAPCLLELELTEPSLFFAFSEGAADRFVAVLARRLGVAA